METKKRDSGTGRPVKFQQPSSSAERPCTHHLRVSICGPLALSSWKLQKKAKLWFLCFCAHAVSLNWNALPLISFSISFLLRSPSDKCGAPSQRPPWEQMSSRIHLFLHLHVEWPLRPLDTKHLLQSCSNSSSREEEVAEMVKVIEMGITVIVTMRAAMQQQ